RAWAVPRAPGGDRGHRAQPGQPRARSARQRRLLSVRGRSRRRRAPFGRRAGGLPQRPFAPREPAHPHARGRGRPCRPCPRGQSEMAPRRDAPRLQGGLRDGGDGRLPLRLRRHRARRQGPSFRRGLRGLSRRCRGATIPRGAQSRRVGRDGRAAGRGDRSRAVAAAAQQLARQAQRADGEDGMSDPIESEEERNRRHAEKMAKRKAARNKMLATKTEERGLVIVHTGTGKGKSTAAFGMVMRCLGHGMRVGIVQFIKGVWDTGERHVLERFPDLVTCRAMGEGFTWDTQDRARDIAAARAAWEMAKGMIADPAYRLVLLDELNIVLRYDYLPIEEVVAALRQKPRELHVIVTGRNAKPELLEVADLVTEMTMVKHPFRSGVKAQAGIEF